MWDIYLGTLFIIAMSAVVFWVGVRACISCSARVSGLLALAAVVFIFEFWRCLHGQLTLAKLLPFSNVIVIGNWIPLGAALLAGILWGKRNLKRSRRLTTCCILCLIALYALVECLLDETPPIHELWTRDGVCLQSDEASCSACSAATLLRHHGIPSSEEEMVALCLTSRRGTRPLGLYRGLKIKTRNTGWRVEVFKTDMEGLPSILSSPAILPMRLDRGADVDPRYERKWGWRPGVAHTVIVYGFTDDGAVRVADPTVGREEWDVESLKILWHGEGLRLVKRDSR